MTNMADKIVIERLEFQGRCGIALEERRRPQPMAIDLELDCETVSAAASDHLIDTVDYAQVAKRVVELGGEEVCALLETLAEKVLTMLFAELPGAPLAAQAGATNDRKGGVCGSQARPAPRCTPCEVH
jgi:FolB domain-containing protein